MSAIKRRDNKTNTSRNNKFRELSRKWLHAKSRLVFGTTIFCLIGFGFYGLLNLRVGEINFRYDKNKGCIDEGEVTKILQKYLLVDVIAKGGGILQQAYPCLEKVHIGYRLPNKVEVKLRIKDAILGVVRTSVDVNDSTGWQDVFKGQRGVNELYFVAQDASKTYFDEGLAVPRISYLVSDNHQHLNSEEISRLVAMLNLIRDHEKSVPKLEYAAVGVVKVSAVSTEELYLSLDDNWEQQLRKAWAVQAFLKLRGNEKYALDARMRDVVVLPK